jgi:predicted amidohydrolase
MRDIPAIRERERRQGVGAVIREAEYCTDFLIVVDQGGPSCMTLPGFRHFVAETAETRVYAFLSAYLVGGLEGHFYPNLYSPTGVDIDATVASANANKDIVRGIKGHAEIGGFARWGIRVMEMAAEIGRRTDLPLLRGETISRLSAVALIRPAR